MGIPKGASIPFGQGRGQYPGREVASFIDVARAETEFRAYVLGRLMSFSARADGAIGRFALGSGSEKR
jgi:hypothetical protein